MTTTKGPTIVCITSHRANAALEKLIGETPEYFSMFRPQHWKECPPEMLTEALKIKGIKKATWKNDMQLCINWG